MTVHEEAGLYYGDFHCRENMMSYWFPRLNKLDVPIPETFGAVLGEDDEPMYEYIVDEMDRRGWSHAFIRGDAFSDKVNLRTGSRIYEADVREVKRTFETLKNHLINHMDTPMGDAVYVREWLDLDYCGNGTSMGHWHPTELRYIVADGEIQYVTPSLETLMEMNLAHDCTSSYVRDRLQESELSEPWEQAKTVAEEFDDLSWHVDFCLTTSMDWYCIDMGVNGVYWHEDDEEWAVMTGQPESVEEAILERAEELLEPPNQ